MHLVGQGGEKDARTPASTSLRADGAAQQVLHLLGEQMLLRHIDLAAQPGFAHRRGQRRNRVDDETLKPLLEQGLAQADRQFGTAVQADALEQAVVASALLPGSGGTPVLREQLRQLFGRGAADLRRAVAVIQQATDQAQLLDLLGRVLPLAIGVARRRREAVTALPHTQGVLWQAGVALDRGDVEGNLFRRGSVHGGRGSKMGGDKRTAL